MVDPEKQGQLKLRYHFVGDAVEPESCSKKLFRKCEHGKHYSDFNELSNAVNKRKEALSNKVHRLGSNLVHLHVQESYQVYVSKESSAEEVQEALFHLNAYRIQHAGTDVNSYPIYRKEDEEYYVFYWDGSSRSSGRGWNTLMFPNVTWVEDLNNDKKDIPFVAL